MPEGLRGEDSIAELCRRKGISSSIYCGWSKEFLEAGKRLAGDTARAAMSDGVRELHREASALKEVVADLTLEKPLLQKRHERGWGQRRTRYPASDQAEIIRLVAQSHLPVRRTLEKLGISKATFYRWYDLYQTDGSEALEQSELSPRELAVRFTDEQKYFVSEASVYHLLKAHDLITSPAYIVINGETMSTIGPRTMVERGVHRQDHGA